MQKEIGVATYTGIWFTPLNPKERDVKIIDIAHALSMVCRFGGHAKKFYSVAEHCVKCAEISDESNKLNCLLHDASEAYIGDMCAPIKEQSDFGALYKGYEKKLQNCINNKFGCNKNKQVQIYDRMMLAKEGPELIPNYDWEDMGPIAQTEIECWSPNYAYDNFINAFKKYTNMSASEFYDKNVFGTSIV